MKIHVGNYDHFLSAQSLSYGIGNWRCLSTCKSGAASTVIPSSTPINRTRCEKYRHQRMLGTKLIIKNFGMKDLGANDLPADYNLTLLLNGVSPICGIQHLPT